MRLTVCFFLFFIVFACSSIYAQPKFEYAKGTDPTKVVNGINQILDKIGEGILKIKDRYSELSNFNKNIIHKAYLKNRVSCKGYCPPWDSGEINYGRVPTKKQETEQSLYLNIDFGDFSGPKGMYSIQPLTIDFIENIKLYLTLQVITNNKELENELLKIIKEAENNLR